MSRDPCLRPFVGVTSHWNPHSLTPRSASLTASKSMSAMFQPVRESSRIWMKFCLFSCLEFLQSFGNPRLPREYIRDPPVGSPPGRPKRKQSETPPGHGEAGAGVRSWAPRTAAVTKRGVTWRPLGTCLQVSPVCCCRKVEWRNAGENGLLFTQAGEGPGSKMAPTPPQPPRGCHGSLCPGWRNSEGLPPLRKSRAGVKLVKLLCKFSLFV